MTRRLLILPHPEEVPAACTGKHTGPALAQTIIRLAEPRGLNGFIVTPEIEASAHDPAQIALTLLIYGAVVIDDQPPRRRERRCHVHSLG